MKLRLPSPLVAALFTAATATLFFAPSCQTAPAIDPALLNPATNSAIRAEPRTDSYWVKHHEANLAAVKKGGIEILFMGDSITDFWQVDSVSRGGQPVWEKNFTPLHAANFGISADRTQHVLWRMAHGELDGLAPKVVVLMIGTNNTGLERDNVTPRNTPAQTAEGVKAVVREFRTRLPRARILLLAIFPRADNKISPTQIPAINAELAKLDDGKYIRYLDLGPKFLNADGVLPKEIMPDLLHPGQRGYEIWADAIRAPLAGMLK